MKTPTIGQTVFLVTFGWRAKDEPKTTFAKVTKVGRKYFELEGCREQFHIESGGEKTQYCSRMQVYETEQEFRDQIEHSELASKLSDVFRYAGQNKLSLDQLRRISAITLE